MKSLVRPFDVLKRFSDTVKSKFYSPTSLDGFYRALVLCSNDPLDAGRIKIFIPVLMEKKYKDEAHGIWAWPTAFWAASNKKADEDHAYTMMKDFGGFMPPPDGSYVYVFFENGDFNKPRYLPFGPALSGGENIKDQNIDPMIPQENQNGRMPWFKWMLMKTPFGRAFFASDDPTDAMIMMRGYNRVVENNCTSPKKECNPTIPDKSIGPYHCGGGPKGSDDYDGLNDPAAYNNKKFSNSMYIIYEGHNQDNKETHDFVLTRDYRHNFIKFSSATWTASPTPVDKGHCNESKDQIEWAIMEHEKSRDKRRIDRLYNHANIKYIVNTEKSHACEDDKFEFSEENIDYMAQQPDWVDQEFNGHRFWLNLMNGNPADGCGGSGNINLSEPCSPKLSISYNADCKWRSEDSHAERRGIGVFRAENALKWVVGEDTPSDESLFRYYHVGKRFMEYLFNGEFLIQDQDIAGNQGFIEIFPCDINRTIQGKGDTKFYMRLKDGHTLWESEKADSSIEFSPLPGTTHHKTSTFLLMEENGHVLLESAKALGHIEFIPLGFSAIGGTPNFLQIKGNGRCSLQNQFNAQVNLFETGACNVQNQCGSVLDLQQDGTTNLQSCQGGQLNLDNGGGCGLNSACGSQLFIDGSSGSCGLNSSTGASLDLSSSGSCSLTSSGGCGMHAGGGSCSISSSSGAGVSCNADGSISLTTSTGTGLSVNPDGTVTSTSGTGDTSVDNGSGSSMTVESDGTIVLHSVSGSEIRMETNGDITMTANIGSFIKIDNTTGDITINASAGGGTVITVP